MSALLDETTTWAEFGRKHLDRRIAKALTDVLHLERPTLVQSQGIPIALEGKDLLCRARTGSGKTICYSVPLLQRLLGEAEQKGSHTPLSGLILVPTKELIAQVHGVVSKLLSFCFDMLSAEPLLSGQKYTKAELPSILVTTPSSLLALLKERQASSNFLAESLKVLVVDEADLMFSFGYEEDMRSICAMMPSTLQAMLVSATLSEEVEALKGLMLHKPAILKLEEPRVTGKLSQFYFVCHKHDKYLILYTLLKLKLVSGKTVIFVSSVEEAYRMKIMFERFSINSAVLNAELPHASRQNIIQSFNQSLVELLIATDDGVGGDPDDEEEFSDEEDVADDDDNLPMEEDEEEEDSLEEEPEPVPKKTLKKKGKAKAKGKGKKRKSSEVAPDDDDEEAAAEEEAKSSKKAKGKSLKGKKKGKKAAAAVEAEKDGDAEDAEVAEPTKKKKKAKAKAKSAKKPLKGKKGKKAAAAVEEEDDDEDEDEDEAADESEEDAADAAAEAAAAAAAEALAAKKAQKQRQQQSGKQKKQRNVDEQYSLTRGVDLQGVTTVINAEVPRTVRSYVHRVGRCARGGASGTALTLCALNEEEQLMAKIVVAQAGPSGMGEVKPLPMQISDADRFRYRVEDVMAGLTKKAIQVYRARELQIEALNSEKLQEYFEEHPDEREALQRAQRALKERQSIRANLKNIPHYLVPDQLFATSTPVQQAVRSEAAAAGVASSSSSTQRKTRLPTRDPVERIVQTGKKGKKRYVTREMMLAKEKKINPATANIEDLPPLSGKKLWKLRHGKKVELRGDTLAGKRKSDRYGFRRFKKFGF